MFSTLKGAGESLDLRITQMDSVAKPETQCRHSLLRVKCHLEDDLVASGPPWLLSEGSGRGDLRQPGQQPGLQGLG